jgi:predicted nuclease of predicted toxin-antitoxin system
MIIWVDAQLPPRIAKWLTSRFSCNSIHVMDLALLQEPDAEVFRRAKAADEVVILTKDRDFADLVRQLGAPPQVLWVTCGNCTNATMLSILERSLPAALQAISRGDALVEIAAPGN